ncbi:MAG: hypothetical protein K0U47_03370 [Epsilonproteobacteria bacterium]|nr:hypothetical protein [Campylobacterota bacterium]
MAEEEFYTLEDEDELETSEESSSEVSDSESKTKKSENKIIYYAIIGLLSLIIILVALFIYLYISKKNDQTQNSEINTTELIQTIQEKTLTPKEQSEAQKLIQKATKLYEEGHKTEALQIYENLSAYNKALSFYNIGVAKLKEKKYKEAILSLDQAMQSNKLKTPSAINAAVAALTLNQKDIFTHYLKLAEKYLPYLLESPLYSYYVSLVNYYKEQPLESLISIQNPSSQFYQDQQNLIAAKALSSIKNDSLAINYLNKIANTGDALALGLLQARVEEYGLADTSLQTAVNIGIAPIKSNIALALVKNKLGLLQSSGDILKSIHDTYKEKAAKTYPIDVKLKASLFDPVYAQKAFKKQLFLDEKYKYSLLFYYAPYRLYNANQTINYITKGAKKIDIDRTSPALGYLKDSKEISDVNIAITEALGLIIDNRVYEANVVFKKALKKHPIHSTLHYNLALSYAQIFDFQNAYKHFSKSYFLNTTNYLALAFKTFCARLINKEIPQNELEQLKNNTNNKEALALVEIALGSLGLNFGYLDAKKETFSHMINLLFAYNRNDLRIYQQSAKDLKTLLPQDIVSNILYLDAYNDKNNLKSYARSIQHTFTTNTLDYSPLFFGGCLPKELYVRLLSIAGISSYGRKVLYNYAKNNPPTIPLLQSIAFSEIYNNNFEVAYKTYNRLIDEYAQKDSHTLFLASVAAIGADKHANAVALLELAKLTDSSNYESRYALGLLYHQAQNLEGASIQYQKIGNNGFSSNYFTFNLKK